MTEINRCLAEAWAMHRCDVSPLFPTKAIQAFHVLSPGDRCQVVAAYMGESGMTDIEALDCSPSEGDPLWIVRGYRA